MKLPGWFVPVIGALLVSLMSGAFIFAWQANSRLAVIEERLNALNKSLGDDESHQQRQWELIGDLRFRAGLPPAPPTTTH